MLMSIRDRTHGWIATIIISLLILSFALWGIHSYLMSGSVNTSVAKVNGVEISKTELAAAYERMQRQVQMQSNSALSLSGEKNLKERALQELIYIQVLTQASLKQNYRISNQQVENYLESMPQFQIKGQFSLARFQQMMAMALYSTNDFLNLIKTTLLIDQPRLGTIFSSFSLPNEVEAAIALVNQERNIQYATLSSNLTKPPVITQDQINAYYKQHATEYQTLEQVSVEYLELSVADLEKKIHPTQQELKQYYEENTSSFATPAKEKQKSVIQPFEKVKDKVAAALIHQKAEEEFANTREKFANVTYEHPDSLKPAATELGLPVMVSESFTKDKAGKGIAANNKVREAAFSNDVLNLQNNSDVIQVSPDSVIVLRVKSHTPAALLALDTVKQQIIKQLQAQAMDAQLKELASTLQNKLETTTNPEQVMQQYHLNWTSIGYIGRHSTKVDSAILDTAFSIPKPQGNQNTTYGITKIPAGYAIIGVTGVKEGVLANKDEYRVFAEQVQNTQGLLEYELYKESLMKKAKIVVS